MKNYSKYYPKIDTIRCFAVAMVMFTHWRYDVVSLRCLELGTLGVNIFFVLSGFLITRILLNARLNSKENYSTKLYTIKAFVIRRCLRILPIYYLYVGFLYFFGRSILKMDITENIGYFLTYTSNFLFFFEQQWDGYISHTWSLSVEEQFYLVFPWLVLFTRIKLLPLLTALLFIIGTLYPILFYKPFVFIVTISCLNSFAIGGFLAYILITNPIWKKKAYLILCTLSVISFVFLFILPFYDMGLPLYKRVFASFWTIGILIYIVDGKNKSPIPILEKLINFILDLKVLQWVGRLSYGIYIYHVITTHLYIQIYKLKIVPIPKPNELDKIWPIQLAMVLFLASVSYYLIEKPLNNKKKYFPYIKEN